MRTISFLLLLIFLSGCGAAPSDNADIIDFAQSHGYTGVAFVRTRFIFPDEIGCSKDDIDGYTMTGKLDGKKIRFVVCRRHLYLLDFYIVR
jgi:hypothetical protein